MNLTVQACARCGADHADLAFQAFARPPLPSTHWAPCPTTGEPILLQVLDDQPVLPALEAITRRLQAVAHIPIDGEPDGNYSGKYYGTPVQIGRSEVKIWRCEDLDPPDLMPSAHELEGTTLADFWEACCDSHWQTTGDAAMAVFLYHVQRDVQTLLGHLGIAVPLPALDERDAERATHPQRNPT